MAITWGSGPEPDPDPATVIFPRARPERRRHAPRRSRLRFFRRQPGRHAREAVPAWR
jgi:hypothetical protein